VDRPTRAACASGGMRRAVWPSGNPQHAAATMSVEWRERQPEGRALVQGWQPVHLTVGRNHCKHRPPLTGARGRAFGRGRMMPVAAPFWLNGAEGARARSAASDG